METYLPTHWQVLTPLPGAWFVGAAVVDSTKGSSAQVGQSMLSASPKSLHCTRKALALPGDKTV